MSKLIERAKAILLTPKTEWPVIAAEPETTAGLYKNYIVILAAIGPIAMFLSLSVIGVGTFLGSMRFGIGAGLTQLVLFYGLGLLGVFLFALVINGFAATFGAQKDSVQALKTAAYAMTASWIAGIGYLLPWLGTLIGIAGAIYSVYLLYLGLPHTMKVPADKAGGYTAVCVIVALVIGWIGSWIVFGVMGRAMWGGYGGSGVAVGDSSFEEGSAGAALEQWAKSMEAAGKQVEASAQANQGAPSADAIGALVGAAVGGGKGVEALSTEQLKRYLPDSLAGLPRTNLSAERNAALGIQVSEVKADYSDGAGRSLNLEIKDTGGAQGLVALANWAGVEEEREWQGGFERTYRTDGRIIHERMDGNRGEYGVIVGERFALSVEGPAASVDELKAALATGVDLAALEQVATAGKSAN
jgi:Yip1 domain